MTLPPLYKYLDVQGAKLTLGNRTFKHSKPSDFKDTEDLTIQSIFPEETEVALKKIEGGFTDVILRHVNDPPTCGSPTKEKLALIRDIYWTNPDAAAVVKAEMEKEGGKPIFNVKQMRAKVEAFVREINEYLLAYRVLCVTTHKDSEEMWSGYAANHSGIALRIEPNVAKDSKFQLFRPVLYRDKRPSLYEHSLDFVADSLFGDQEVRRKIMMEKIVYAKTLGWEHESEYRLAIPMRQGEEPWNTLRFHPEVITELYLGLAIENADMEEIIQTARAINPEILVFQAQRNGDRRLRFRKV